MMRCSALADSLHSAAAECPTALAVRCGETSLTYAQLQEAVAALRAELPSVAGLRVVLMLPDGIASYLLHLTCFLEGAILVPISPRTPAEKVRRICDRVAPHLVITNPLLHARHAATFSALPCVRTVSDRAETPWRFVFDISGPAVDRGEKTASELRLIVFTSGSTGEPKGVCLTEQNILFAAAANTSILALDRSRRSVVTVPLYDFYGFIQIYSHLLGAAACVFGHRVVFPKQLLASCTEATDLVLVPHTLRQLLGIAENGTERDAFAALKHVTSSSDQLDPALLRLAFAINPALTVFNIYGLTEAGRSSFRRIDSSSADSPSIGRAPQGVQISLEPVGPDGGEIVIRGPNVMAGYFAGIDGDSVVLDQCSEMRTGDLGRYDENGEIVLLGRGDSLLNIKGEKIHPAEIEWLALQVAGVRDALARAVSRNGETVVGLEIVAAEGASPGEAVRANLYRFLPPAVVPRQISVVRKIARTELGSKLVRRNAAV